MTSQDRCERCGVAVKDMDVSAIRLTCFIALTTLAECNAKILSDIINLQLTQMRRQLDEQLGLSDGTHDLSKALQKEFQ